MAKMLIIDEKSREIVELLDGYDSTATRRASELAGQSESSFIVCQVVARVSSSVRIETETDRYPDLLFGGTLDQQEVIPEPVPVPVSVPSDLPNAVASAEDEMPL